MSDINPLPSRRPKDLEADRLRDDASRKTNWKRWGPYLSDRQWGTVREDYSPDGSAWQSFPFEQADSRAYRWGEDGLLGITDRECRLCFAVALWNGKDPILKERLFGLTNPQGNHGEDVKELYWHLDATPTSSYLKAVYKYPQAEFPYAELLEENAKRTRAEPEYEIQDTGAFDGQRYFDVFTEYAKSSPDDVLIRITVVNRGPESAELHLLPTVWFRNAWTWGCTHDGCYLKPLIRQAGPTGVVSDHVTLGKFRVEADPSNDAQPIRWLFADNETNTQKLYNVPNATRSVKDALQQFVVHGEESALDPRGHGTKVAPYYRMTLGPGESREFRLRLFDDAHPPATLFGADFLQTFVARIAEADVFYNARIPQSLSPTEREISRRAYAGLLWSKQFYHYVIKDWLDGDPNTVKPPEERKHGRNSDWRHLFNRDVISMPDKWEYPWYASWDLAFHMVPMAYIDPVFAREQLILLLREWYMHPNGQLPAYEWALGDVNPPVHAWACWRVYKIAGRGDGTGRDRMFLRRVFHKLLINFTWWVNRKDPSGKHVFAGGFLGMDNVGLFDRSAPLPDGTFLNQADGTAWMAVYCGVMLDMALELAKEDAAYEDVASKFFEHFIAIADAINTLGGTGLWDEEDGFYYDQLAVDGKSMRLRARSMVGIIPLLANQVIDEDTMDRLPGFAKRTRWFMEHRSELAGYISYMERSAQGQSPGATRKRFLLAIPSQEKLVQALRYVLDEKEFLSPFGVRSMSAFHRDHPVTANLHGKELSAHYAPGESDTGMFGGNSNWRGPIWFPTNYLLIEALQRYYHFYGDTLKVECPTGSGVMMHLDDVAAELERRLLSVFVQDSTGRRPANGKCDRLDGVADPQFAEQVTFFEYFDGDTGRGLGASHQTGWTALIAKIIRNLGVRARRGGNR